VTTQSQQIDQSSKFLQRISGLTFFLICLASSAIAGGLLFLIFGILATSLDGGPGLVTLMALGGFLIGLVGSIVYLKHRRKPSVIRSQSNETNTMKAAASLENNKVTNNINPLPNLLTLDDHTESKGEDQGEMIVDHKNIHERFFIPAEVRWQKRFSLIENMGDLTWANYVKLFKSLPLKERIPLISILAIFFGVLYYLWLGMWRKALIILATIVLDAVG
jgi:hypothetical protein